MLTSWPTSSRRVVVWAGGTSAERQISLESGAHAARALEEAGCQVVLADPAQTAVADWPWQPGDVCFLTLHGGAGEDGTVQSQLAAQGIPFTGSGPEASRLAMSKSASKERFVQHGVPTADYVLLHAADSTADSADKTQPLGWPLIIKPDSQGSSLGVTRVDDASQFDAALAAAWAYDTFALAERWLPGDEYTIPFVDHQPLPILEIVLRRPLFDYHAKYQDPRPAARLPRRMNAARRKLLTATARAACVALGTRGLVRVDLRCDAVGLPHVLEINTIPGLTPHSLVPRAAAAAGLSFSGLCLHLVELACTGAASHQGQTPSAIAPAAKS